MEIQQQSITGEQEKRRSFRLRLKPRPGTKLLILLFVAIPLLFAARQVYPKQDNAQETASSSEITSVESSDLSATSSHDTSSSSVKSSSSSNKKTVKAARYHAWIPYWDQEKALDTVNSHPSKFTSISPTWYAVAADGSINIKGGYNNQLVADTVRGYNITLIPSISNPSAEELSVILNNEEARTFHVDSIVAEVVNSGYEGIDIDYEEILGDDRAVFSAFIKELSEKLHAQNKLLTIAILWKADPVDILEAFSESRRAQDWKAIAPHVDQFRIMAYDFTHSYNGEGPIAPAYWIEDILKYALTQTNEDKIVLGLPFYAYDWEQGATGGASALVWEEVNAIKTSNPDLVISDKLLQGEKQLKYTSGEITRIVWYQDAQVTNDRINLAKAYGIYQFAFWRLGGEDPVTWK